MAEREQRIIIDTDPGMGFPWADIDDNLAILFALAQEHLSVELVSIVCGNTPAEEGVQSARKTLSLAGRPIPVAMGARRPLVRPYQSGRSILAGMGRQRGADLSYRGETWGGGKDSPAPWAYPMHVDELKTGKRTFVCVGPLTNMAFLLQQQPELQGNIECIVIMGGALALAGNISPFAEFNTWVDPEAARIVFDSAVEKVLVPLDVTTTVEVTPEEIRRAVGTRGALARFVADSAEGWVEALKGLSGKDSFNPHDPIALAWLVDPDLFETQRMNVTVEERTGKMTGRESQSGTTLACQRVDIPGFKRIFLESLGKVVSAPA